MMGIDEEYALLQMVGADLSVKWKNLLAEENTDAVAFATYQKMGAFAPLYA